MTFIINYLAARAERARLRKIEADLEHGYARQRTVRLARRDAALRGMEKAQ